MPDVLRVLLAPNSFKGSATAHVALRALRDGVTAFSRISSVECRVREVPICDGGTGFVEILAGSSRPPAEVRHVACLTPAGQDHSGKYAWRSSEGVAIVESAETIGLALVDPAARNPLHTSTRGLGQLLRTVLEDNPRRILVGCGDTATADCGVGMLAELGVHFFDAEGDEVLDPRGRDLVRISAIDDRSSVLAKYDGTIELACNLSSVARGAGSSALVYSMQKGASEEEAKTLAAGFDSFCRLAERHTGHSDLGLLPGSGAAGGVGFAIGAFASDTDFRYSFEVTFDAIDLNNHLRWADVVITGEGLFDRTSGKGKAPVAAALRAKLHDTVTIAVVGALEAGILSRLLRSGFDVIEPFSDRDLSLDHYMKDFYPLAKDACTRSLLNAWPTIRSRT